MAKRAAPWDYVSGINRYIADLESCVEQQASLIRLLDAARSPDADEGVVIRRTRRAVVILTTRLCLGEQEASDG